MSENRLQRVGASACVKVRLLASRERGMKNCFYFLTALLLAMLSIGCDDLPAPSPTPDRHPAEPVVENMYAALAANDMDAFMDTMLPANRRQPNPFMLIRGLVIGYGPVGIDLAQLTDISIPEVEVRVIQAGDGYALVQAEGYVRYPSLLLELPFCDQHDARLEDGQWYVDVYAPEREARLSRLMEQRAQALQNQDWAVEEPEDLAGVLQILGEGMGMALNTCDDALSR